MPDRQSPEPTKEPRWGAGIVTTEQWHPGSGTEPPYLRVRESLDDVVGRLKEHGHHWMQLTRHSGHPVVVNTEQIIEINEWVGHWDD